ncbi:MAG: DUF4139 domain-containing protein [Deltaproteobacteria bacterium]|nr:DUF4139 domain-containing protein [Deltaproteobacteria bacterium]
MEGTIRLESSIDRVVVYRRGARVTRRAPLAPLAGRLPGEVAVAGLPLGIEDASVRVRVLADDGKAPPVARDLRVGLEVAAVDPSLPPPESPELRAARRRVASLREEMVRLSDEQSRLRGLEQSQRPDGKRGEPPPPSPFDARMALVRFVAERGERLDSRMAAVGAELLVAEETLEACIANERESSSDRQKRHEQIAKVVHVRLGDGDAVAASLLVSYVVAAARWCPSYTMQASAGFGTVRLGVRGAVCQATGEDWRGIALVLSTAEPERWHELPTLASLRIGKRQPRPMVRGWRPPPADTDSLFLAYDEGRPRSPAAPPDERPVPVPARLRGRPSVVGGRVRAYETTARDDDEDTMVNRPELRARRADVAPLAKAKVSLEQPEDRTAALEAGKRLTETGALVAPDVAFQPQSFPMAPAASVGRAKGGGLLAGLGDLLAGSGGASLEEDYLSRTLSVAVPTAGPAGGARRPMDAPAPADEPLLAYDALRMAAADSDERGSLVAVETRERYVEEIVRVRGTLVRESVLVALDRAVDGTMSRATEIASRALPPRCVDPGSSQGFDYAYPAASRIDVPSDGSFHSVPLAEQESPAQLRHVVVPRESTDVYRLVELDNPIDAPLLDGPVDVYLGGRYVVTSDLRTVPAGGRISLGIGVEQRVKVARNSRYAEETEGLMRGTIALKHDVSVEVTSHLDEPCDLEVRERLPTTLENDDEVRVDLGKVDPPWESWDPKLEVGPPLRGGYRWRLTIPRGERRTLTAGYVVRTSSKYELQGGNRRER